MDDLKTAIALGMMQTANEPDKDYSPDDVVGFTMTRRQAAVLGSQLAISYTLLRTDNMAKIVRVLGLEDLFTTKSHILALAGISDDEKLTTEIIEKAEHNLRVAQRVAIRLGMEEIRLFGPKGLRNATVAAMEILASDYPTEWK